MLAAGLGRRLFGDDNAEPPKSLLRFDGVTLLARHVEALVQCGASGLTVVVGHRHEDLREELAAVAPAGFVDIVYNPRFKEGPKLSLARGGETLRSGDSVLFMDADVLYHVELMERLVNSAHESCFVMDRAFQSTDDFVKVCLRNGRIVDFGKIVGETFDVMGEWPGLCRFDPATAAQIADSVDGFIARDDIEGAYEEAFREVLAASPPDTFGVEDITGIPWVEIDYETDLEKAATRVLPRILKHDTSPARSA